MARYHCDLELCFDPFQNLDRVEHGALKINRVDFAGGADRLPRELEDLIAAHPLRHAELVERMRRDRRHAGLFQMAADQVVQASVERSEEKSPLRRISPESGDRGVERRRERNLERRFETAVKPGIK